MVEGARSDRVALATILPLAFTYTASETESEKSRNCSTNRIVKPRSRKPRIALRRRPRSTAESPQSAHPTAAGAACESAIFRSTRRPAPALTRPCLFPVGNIAIAVDEQTQEGSSAMTTQVRVVNVSDDRHPDVLSEFPVPDGDYRQRGGGYRQRPSSRCRAECTNERATQRDACRPLPRSGPGTTTSDQRAVRAALIASPEHAQRPAVE